jgi:hypothetical protein
MDWQIIREVVVPIVAVVGGLVGLIGGSLSIYYSSTSNRILLNRFRREEEAKAVEARADDLMRHAHETSGSSGSMMSVIPLELTDEIDKKAAWKLCKEGHGSMHDNKVTLFIDRLPKVIAEDMARRAARAPDHFH